MHSQPGRDQQRLAFLDIDQRLSFPIRTFSVGLRAEADAVGIAAAVDVFAFQGEDVFGLLVGGQREQVVSDAVPGFFVAGHVVDHAMN